MNRKVNFKLLAAAGIAVIMLLLSLAVIGICEATVGGMKKSVDFIKAGERWSGDGSQYAVIAAYMEDECGIDENQLEYWAHSMDSALTEASVTSAGGRAWTWSASFETELSPVGSKGSATAEVTAAAGDFFVFHQFNYLYGCGFLNDTSNPMGVVLDEDLAWKLFGAQNIVGMTFRIGDEEYTVTGVCVPESKHGVYGHTYGDRPRMYMSYAGYSKLASGKTFTVYETAMPNPVKKFARNIFDNIVSLNEERSTVIEASDRFSLSNRFDNMKKLRYSWISANKLSYPYWENEARVYDYRGAKTMIIEIIAASVGGVALISSIIMIVASGFSPVRVAKNIAADVRRKKHKKSK